jgi:hypothetical protein
MMTQYRISIPCSDISSESDVFQRLRKESSSWGQSEDHRLRDIYVFHIPAAKMTKLRKVLAPFAGKYQEELAS